MSPCTDLGQGPRAEERMFLGDRGTTRAHVNAFLCFSPLTARSLALSAESRPSREGMEGASPATVLGWPKETGYRRRGDWKGAPSGPRSRSCGQPS